jgi:hypothetical protein
VLVGLALLLVVALALGPGLAAMRTVSEAEAKAEVWDDDGEVDGEPDPDGELDPEGDPDDEPDVEAEPGGEVAEPGGGVAEPGGGVDTGVLLGLVVVAGELEEPEAEGDGVGVDGFGVGVGVDVGLGEGVLEAGSTWQLVSVLAPVEVPALVEVRGLGEAAASLDALACAVPGRPASTPRVSKPPLSTLSAVTRTCTRTCARRMRIALSPLLIRLLSAHGVFGGVQVTDGSKYSYPVYGQLCI